MTAKRNVWALIGVGLLWFIIFWFGSLFLLGVVAGATHHDDAQETARAWAALFSGPIFLLALIGAPTLTAMGVLPGSGRKAAKTECVIDYDGLEKLVVLHKNGHLTDEEFGRQKTSILRKCD